MRSPLEALRSFTPRALRALTPGPLRRLIVRRRLARDGGGSIAETFDRIYREGRWAGVNASPSGGGSIGPAAEAYIALMREFIARHRIRSIVDIGCGDFAVGARLAPLVEHYLALDVSREIVSRNRVRFAALANVTFQVADATVEVPPRADLVTIRQVLQHLTNRQIASILANVETSGSLHWVVTEHVPEPMRHANRDLPTQSSGTRVALGSGVDVTRAPFARAAERIATIALPPHLAHTPHAREVLSVHWRRLSAGTSA